MRTPRAGGSRDTIQAPHLWCGLRLKHPEARLLSCAGHLDGLGYRITREDHRALPRALKRLGRKVRADIAGMGGVDVTRSIAATMGVVLLQSTS